MKVANGMRACYQRARSYFDKLTQSVPAQALRGELVPQDPRDEPAAVLLERLCAARASAPGQVNRLR
ncbi:MAG TPA: hypothetical protein VNA16_02100 [Abditibacteriaceae bacterium]|nr:hypothetical protein [Abditibacteriaceae bacterium]